MMDLQSAVSAFLRLGDRLLSTQSLSAEHVLDAIVAWYLRARINRAVLAEDGDMLLLQWGATRMFDVTQPTDLRSLSAETVGFRHGKVRYLDITRQVFAPEDEEAEFDGSAVQMSFTLGYDEADGTEPNSNIWIRTPAELDDARRHFLAVPFVQSLLTIPPRAVTVVVDHCG